MACASTHPAPHSEARQSITGPDRYDRGWERTCASEQILQEQTVAICTAWELDGRVSGWVPIAKYACSGKKQHSSRFSTRAPNLGWAPKSSLQPPFLLAQRPSPHPAWCGNYLITPNNRSFVYLPPALIFTTAPHPSTSDLHRWASPPSLPVRVASPRWAGAAPAMVIASVEPPVLLAMR